MKRVISIFLAILIILANTALDVQSVFAAQSSAIDSGNVIITNNLTGKSDTIYIFGLEPGSLVKVYTSSTGSKILTYGTVSNSKSEIKFSVPQIGTGEGSLYISVIEKGNTESKRTKVNFDSEPRSTPISADSVSITNNAQKADTIYVSGLNPRDSIKVYSAQTGGTLLGSKTVSSTGSDVTFTVKQVGSKEGFVYVSVTSKGFLESVRTPVKFDAEPVSPALEPNSIAVNNNARGADTIYISGINGGDIVKIYNYAGKLLTSKTIPSNAYETTISIPQLGSAKGVIYATVTTKDCAESDKVSIEFEGELFSEVPDKEYIVVTNNSGKPDTITVSGLSPNDMVKVYNASSKGSLLGSGTVPSAKNEVTISIAQLSVSQGTVFISVTSVGRNESSRIDVDYEAEGKTDNNYGSNITVTNNVGKADTVYVTGLTAGDTVKVYDSSTGGRLLGSDTVGNSSTTATVSISQLGIRAGKVYVSITNSGKLESGRNAVSYPAESKTSTIGRGSITVSNNAGSADTVYVTGLSSGTIVRVYNAASSGYQLGYATVATGKTEATVTIQQLSTSGGAIYVSVTEAGAQESDRIQVPYDAEGKSTAPDINDISISNNVGKADTIYISNLTPGDIVRIYDAPSQGKIISSKTVEGSSTDTTLTVSQLGARRGYVYLTVTSTGKAESIRTAVEFKAESIYEDVNVSNVTVTNNAIISDTVYFSRLSAGDIVKVYDSRQGGTLLASGVVPSGSTDIIVEIPQLGKGAGSVFVTVSSPDKSESARKEVTYAAENKSQKLNENQIEVTNNIIGTPDTVFVSGLAPGDIIRAYSAASQGTLLGKATVPAAGVSATISVPQLGTNGGTVYVSVTNPGKLEGDLQGAQYGSEEKSSAPNAADISVNNNSGAADTVKVTGLAAGDVVKVYASETAITPIGSATVATYGSEAIVTITELSNIQLKIFVSVTSANKSESSRVGKTYDKEPVSGTLTDKNITVINNAGIEDTVKVTGLTPGDIIKVYNQTSGGTLLGSATVPASSTYAIATIPQLGVSDGIIYVSITSINMAEGNRTAVTYPGEQQSQAPDALKISVENNYGIASTITIRGLKDNDVVSVYDAAEGGTPLAQGTVATYSSEITLQISRLKDIGGDLYISVTSTGKLESNRTTVHYGPKSASTAPNSSNVEISNNVVYADTITIIGIEPGAVVKVYKEERGGNPIGSATMPSDGSDAIITVAQLGVNEGVVYVSVTTSGKTESTRTSISYSKEESSQPLLKGNVTVINNSGMSDTIIITGLQAYDTVKVYSAETGGTRLATLYPNANTLTATGNISLASTEAGSIYVSVTNYGKSESSRTKIDYEAESVAPRASDITVENNAGTPDIITIEGLTQNDIVKVYDSKNNGNILVSQKLTTAGNRLILSVPQLTANEGKIYVSVTNFGRAESSLTEVGYIAETSTPAPYIGDIYINNNVDIDDTVIVYNLLPNDVVKVYDAPSGGNLLGYASVPRNKTEATVSLEDLGSSAGVVYVSVITKGKTESHRTEVSYVAEGRTTAPYPGNIYVTNNVTISDTVLVTGLNSGDKVKVYNSSAGGELLGSATVTEGSRQARITIKQLGEESGSVYVSVTSKGRTESKRTEAEYVSEQTTNAPYSGFIEVINNSSGTSDTIIVSELQSGDIVNVYSAPAGGSILGTAQVTSGGNSAVVTVGQLGKDSGSIYVTVTTVGRFESSRTKVDFSGE